MLKKFKIGTKLAVGFFLVLFLLVFVAACGYYGLQQAAKSAASTEYITKIRNGSVGIRKQTFEARLAAAYGVLYRDEKYKTNRQANDAELAKIYDATVQLLADDKTQEDNNKDLTAINNAYKKFAEIDDKWYALENERKTKLNELAEKALFLNNELVELANTIKAAMIKPEESQEINGQRFVTEKRMEQLQNCEQCLRVLQELRRLFYQYFSQTDEKKKQENQESIVKSIEELRNKYSKVAENLTTKAGKEISAEIIQTIDIWEANFKINIKYIQEQKSIDEQQVAVMADMNDLIKNIDERLVAQSEKILEETKATEEKMLVTIGIISVFALAVGIVVSFVLSRNITSGLKFAMDSMNRVVLEGDLSAEIPSDVLSRKDEIGDMARVAGAVLSDYHTIDSMATSLAAYEWQLTVKEKGPLDTMNQNLNRMLEQVNQALSEIKESVKQVSTGSGEVSSAAQTLSSGAQESSASLEEITASMSEISSQTRANAQSAGEARDLAHNATQAAAEGQEAMKQMNESMVRITKNSNEIQRVIKVIDDIAFQTNLLALNAAVEAARAGAHGKGFAVVAEEVRNLAARSAKAAQETSELISTSGKEIEKGGEVSSRTSDVLNSIVEQVKQTADLVGGIAIASNEQAQGVSQVTIGLQQIDAVTQQNTAAAEESASAANEMSSMAAKLQELVEKFKLRV
ncbi:MAG: methyl-accepting chemotaxis protein [Planctomycetaceae bacterium]|jgi:methyl-accepting chemotaxis protein|nr:methyl-accepting chemotaxis protein [Planctomycetaceae bacterium]